MEKALQIKLARDVDGATFWGALDEALVPRLKANGAGAEGDAALAALANVFKDRSLKKGFVITLTWVQPSTLKVLWLLHQSFLSKMALLDSFVPCTSVAEYLGVRVSLHYRFSFQSTKVHLSFLLTGQMRLLLVQIAVAESESANLKTESSIESKPLLLALYDVFLGPDAVSPSAKVAVAEGITKLL